MTIGMPFFLSLLAGSSFLCSAIGAGRPSLYYLPCLLSPTWVKQSTYYLMEAKYPSLGLGRYADCRLLCTRLPYLPFSLTHIL